jgi:hypothetical protein
MYASILLSVALALVNLPLSRAFEEIDTKPTVTAGQDTTIQIVNDLSSGSQSYDAQFDSYRVYLSLAPPGWGPAPACYLVNSSAINVTSQTVQIPASVGPSDPSSQDYSIATMEFNQDPNAGGPSGIQYSNVFDFVGGTGNWSDYELAGYLVGDYDYIPCSAYDCARQCSQKYYPNNVDSYSISAYKPTYECIAACPGVSYPPFQSIYGGSGGPSAGPSGGGPSSGVGDSSFGLIGTTSFAAAGGFTQIHPSPTSGGSSSPSATGIASNSQISSAAPSGTSTASSTASASTPTTSKSAATLVSSSQSALLAVSLTVLFRIFGL